MPISSYCTVRLSYSRRQLILHLKTRDFHNTEPNSCYDELNKCLHSDIFLSCIIMHFMLKTSISISISTLQENSSAALLLCCFFEFVVLKVSANQTPHPRQTPARPHQTKDSPPPAASRCPAAASGHLTALFFSV